MSNYTTARTVNYNTRTYVIRVQPVGKIPDTPTGWEFKGKNWKHGRKAGSVKYPADSKRKVLLVRRVGSKRLKRTDNFFIDIPKHFFDAQGNFALAHEMKYSTEEILHVQWTGSGTGHSGWIDLNYAERGGTGGGSAPTTSCTKWS